MSGEARASRSDGAPPLTGHGAVRVLFRAYRAALAPLVGPVCRFEPSCSHYAEQALERHGWWRGLLLVAWRLLRCQPFSRGGIDPVPERRVRPSLGGAKDCRARAPRGG